jgi:hypothetical protein
MQTACHSTGSLATCDGAERRAQTLQPLPDNGQSYLRVKEGLPTIQSDTPDAQCRVVPLLRKGQLRLDSLRRAMTGTLQHAQIGPPRTNCITILVGHYTG